MPTTPITLPSSEPRAVPLSAMRFTITRPEDTPVMVAAYGYDPHELPEGAEPRPLIERGATMVQTTPATSTPPPVDHGIWTEQPPGRVKWLDVHIANVPWDVVQGFTDWVFGDGPFTVDGPAAAVAFVVELWTPLDRPDDESPTWAHQMLHRCQDTLLHMRSLDPAYNARDTAHDLSFRAMSNGPRGGMFSIREAVSLPEL